MDEKPKVLIVMGSDSDLPVMEEARRALEALGIPCRMTIASAHRSPQRAVELAKAAAVEGIQVIIAGAGGAAHLAGFMASHTTLPVIGVPVDSSPLGGWDSLLATVQMPPGVPVATMAVGKAGAKNAGIFAAQILALLDPKVRERLEQQRGNLSLAVEQKARRLEDSPPR